MTELMTHEAAVRHLRADPRNEPTIRNAYLDADVHAAAQRFAQSAEFAAARKLVGDVRGQRLLDLGAGNGIASYAWAKAGALVTAVEPDPSNEIGRRAIQRLCSGLPVEIIDARGELLPLSNETMDVIYARQVLHHAADLGALLRECARVLRPDGVALACREHVVNDARQLRTFLSFHPIHQLAGGENAFRLNEYLDAFAGAQLTVERVIEPWESVVNAHPFVEDDSELPRAGKFALQRYYGRIGRVAAHIPGVPRLFHWWITRPAPGRLYTFLARKHA